MKNGMIVAPQPEAAEAGADVLRRGGNAVDAAIACAFTQSAVDPFMCGIGGFGSMHVYMPNKGVHEILEFYARAPLACTPDMWESKFIRQMDDGFAFLLEGAINELGYLSICTPGTLRGYDRAVRAYGTMEWADLVRPAISYARDGFMVRPDVYAYWTQRPEFGEATVLQKLQYSETGRAIYFNDDGSLKRPGDIVVNADYARILERIARDGADAFYNGDVGDEIVADMASHGGLISKKDLSEFQVSAISPVWSDYRGYRIATSPPPGSGVSMMQLLLLMENFDLGPIEHSSSEHLRLLTEAMRWMTIDKDRMADPEFVDVPVQHLLSKHYNRGLAARIKAGERAQIRRAEKPHPRETTHISVIDKDGNAVAMTHSLGMPSGVITKGLGFMYNGLMSRFDPRPGHAGSLAGGKRRLSSAAPTIVFKDEKPYLVIGAPGGSHIAPSVAQAIMNVIDFEMSMVEAVSAPRVMAVTTALEVCNRIRRGVTDELAQQGYDIRRLWKTFAFAGVHGIRIDDGICSGGADPGFDGLAIAVPSLRGMAS